MPNWDKRRKLSQLNGVPSELRGWSRSSVQELLEEVQSLALDTAFDIGRRSVVCPGESYSHSEAIMSGPLHGSVCARTM